MGSYLKDKVLRQKLNLFQAESSVVLTPLEITYITYITTLDLLILIESYSSVSHIIRFPKRELLSVDP